MYPLTCYFNITCFLLGCGILSSLIAGIIVDKTKRFEEVAKVCLCLCSLFYIVLTVLQCYNNYNGLIRGFLILSFCFVGIFGLPLLPVFMEMSIECVYPIPEATPTGFLFIGGQLVGIIIILINQEVSQDVSINSYIYQQIQTCVPLNLTLAGSQVSLTVLDYKYPFIGQTSLIVCVSILFAIFYKCPYKRLNHERNLKNTQMHTSNHNS